MQHIQEYPFYSKLLNKDFFVIMNFNKAQVINGFSKTLSCILEILHKGAFLLSITKQFVLTFLNLYQVVLQGQVQK